MNKLMYFKVVLIILLLSEAIACQHTSNIQAPTSSSDIESSFLSKVIIDRFEGEFVVCELPDRTIVNIRKTNLPDGTKEGDVLVIESGKIRVDLNETLKRKETIESLKPMLWK